MGVFGGPDLSESGLVLALDGANSKGFDDDENLLTYSEDFANAIWQKQNGFSITSNTAIAPDGTLTADTASRVNLGSEFLYQIYGAAGTFTLSCWVRTVTGTSTFNMFGYNGTNGTVGDVQYTATTTWQRFSTTATVTTSTGWYPCIPAVSGVQLYIWGAQLERSSSPSPYYPTTGTAKTRGTTWSDLSGNGNNGTLTNGPTFDSSNLGSIVFDGVNDYFNMTSNFNIAGVTNYSSSFWVNLNSSTTGVDVRFFWHGNYGVLVYKTTANNLSFYLRTTVTNIQTATPFSSFIGVWTNIAVTYDGSTMRLYVNGDLKNSASHSGGIVNDNPTRFWLGGASTQYFTSCKISGVLEYNRALTAQEIQQNFNATRSRYSI